MIKTPTFSATQEVAPEVLSGEKCSRNRLIAGLVILGVVGIGLLSENASKDVAGSPILNSQEVRELHQEEILNTNIQILGNQIMTLSFGIKAGESNQPQLLSNKNSLGFTTDAAVTYNAQLTRGLLGMVGDYAISVTFGSTTYDPENITSITIETAANGLSQFKPVAVYQFSATRVHSTGVAGVQSWSLHASSSGKSSGWEVTGAHDDFFQLPGNKRIDPSLVLEQAGVVVSQAIHQLPLGDVQPTPG